MVEVEIGGQQCRIASPYDAAYTARIADYLNAKLAQGAGGLPAHQALILVAFDVIDELLQERGARRKEKARLETGLEAVLARLDTLLAAEAATSPREIRP